MTSLKQQTLKGIAFLGAGKSAGRLLSFINTLILARLLSPEDYGLMAMAMVVVGFIQFFNDIGFGSAIIQRKDITQSQLSGVFYLSFVISIVLFIFTYFTAYLVADFYNKDELTTILQVLAVTFVLGSVKAVPEAMLVKEMRFKVLSGIEFISIVLQCVITLIFAYYGYKTWSLVYGLIVSSLVRSLIVFYSCRWLPSLRCNIVEAFDLLKFGATVTYSRVTWYVYTNASTFIIGKVSGEKQLGVFSMAVTITDLVTSHITSLIIQVASPLFSRMQTNLDHVCHALYRLTSGLALITFPVLIGIAITADELVPVLLGEQWLSAIFPLQALTFIGLAKSIDPLLTQALISTGQANVAARYTSICAILIPISVYFGASYNGIDGAAVALSLTYPVLLIVLLFMCKSTLNVSIKKYVRQLMTPFLGALFMAAAVFGVDTLLSKELHVVLTLMIKVIVGVIAYSVFIIYLRKEGIAQVKEVLVEMGINEEKLDRWPFKKQEKITNEH